MKTLLPILSLFALAACSGDVHFETHSSESNLDLPESYHAGTADPAAVDVFDVRMDGKDGQEVVVKGTVQDISERMASIKLFDESLEHCAESGDDLCATPWDFCCEDSAKVKAGQITVEFLDGDEPGKWGVKGFHGLDLLSEVVVTGKLHVDVQNNMRIAAANVHVRR